MEGSQVTGGAPEEEAVQGGAAASPEIPLTASCLRLCISVQSPATPSHHRPLLSKFFPRHGVHCYLLLQP